MEACTVAAANRATRRGRPKGSGLDDSDHLDRVVALMRAEPWMSASAAIRRAVSTDPSTIRRLRDKLRAMHPSFINRTPPFGR